MLQRQIVCAADRCGKTHQLAHAARAAIAAGGDPRQILALAVHRAAANRLRATIHTVAQRRVPTATLRRRALHILSEEPIAAQLPSGWNAAALLSGIDRRLLIREAWARAGAADDSLWRQRGNQPGALDWIVLLFDRFSAWSGTADPRRLPQLAPDDPRLAELWQAYRQYLLLCRQHGVVAFNEVFNRAADALRHPLVRRRYVPRVLLLDDLDLFQPAELGFVAALIGAATDVFATCAAPPAADGPIALERFLDRWIAQFDFSIAPVAYDSPPPALSLGAYDSPDAEVHAIAHRIIADGHPPRPDDYAIIAYDSELVPLMQRILPQYGVPVQGEAARDGYTLALAPLALFGLKLLADHPLTIRETTTLLRHPALRLSVADAHILGEAVTQRRFQPFDPADGRWPPELSAAGKARIDELRATTAALAEADDPPSARLGAWLLRLNLQQPAWAQTEAALEPWAVAVDRRHWERLIAFLQQSEAIHVALGTPLQPAEAVEVWSSALALIVPEGRPYDHAVQIWTPIELGGCTARHVFVAGLHEGALPQPLAPLPFGDDAALEAAFGSLPGFVAPQIENRSAAWARGQRDLQRAIGRAQATVHLSYSRTDRQQRRRLPSPLLEAISGQWSAISGQWSAISGQWSAISGQWSAISSQWSVISDQRAEMINQQPSTSNLRPPTFDLQPSTFDLRPSTFDLQPSTFDLRPPTFDPQAPFVVSPSAIEDYFTCPRRCFFARELGLYDVASSPRQALGTVVHNALHDLLRDARVIPISEARAIALVNEHWQDDEHRWGSRLKRAVFRRLAERAATQLARYEDNVGTAGAAFVGGELGFTWRLDDSAIVLNGRIDRVDRDADGLRVIDYKLGRHNPSINALLNEFVPPRDPVAAESWRPGDIQLPVYALAIERGEIDGLERRSDERVASVALVYPLELYTDSGKLSSRGIREIKIVDHGAGCTACGGKPTNAKTGVVCRAQLQAVEGRVRAAVGQMRAGAWQPDPRDGSTTCASCNFRPICPDPR